MRKILEFFVDLLKAIFAVVFYLIDLAFAVLVILTAIFAPLAVIVLVCLGIYFLIKLLV